jgi:hypothetical protein
MRYGRLCTVPFSKMLADLEHYGISQSAAPRLGGRVLVGLVCALLCRPISDSLEIAPTDKS